MTQDDSNLSLAERRARRPNRQLPVRFRDVIPEASSSLPPNTQLSSALSQERAHQPENPQPSVHARCSPLRRILRSPRNIFGLFRQYYAEKFPSHDPEERIALDDLTDTTEDALEPHDALPSAQQPFGPYPNRNSFRLGEWYWNDGVQKSQKSFKELIDIVGDHEFNPSDVRDTKWKRLNQQLADDNSDWADDDENWVSTPVTIKVPFHRFTANPGSRDYVVDNFYHRSLVSVIRERLTNEADSQHFHFEPYKLYWQPGVESDPVRIHGEVYTSPAFIDAHTKLQDSPGEPGCDLPRVVIALMFASDATHLTSFGDAKLWPLYLFIGNESKYRRCKPSCHSCSHVAYFQKVSTISKCTVFFKLL
jgi:hypothetical protein